VQFRSRGYTCVSDFDSQDCMITLHSSDPSQPDITFPQHFRDGLLYSDPIIIPTTVEQSRASNTSPALVRQLTRDHERHLWHQRFGHIHSRRLAHAHQFATGVPKIF
jgi:hypothetical protein